MTGAYYNENDPFAAAWLRELIKAGHIAAGEVDDRSIHDVRPDDLRGFTQCHFFAGVGVWSYALRLGGWPDDRPVWTGSCPCQPFSVAGKRLGASDPRNLWPIWLPLIREHGPATILGEQVAQAAGYRWWDTVSADLEAENYACGAADLAAASVGAPHIRQRLYWMANATDSGRQRGRTGQAGNAGSAARLEPKRFCDAGGLGHAYGEPTWRVCGATHSAQNPLNGEGAGDDYGLGYASRQSDRMGHAQNHNGRLSDRSDGRYLPQSGGAGEAFGLGHSSGCGSYRAEGATPVTRGNGENGGLQQRTGALNRPGPLAGQWSGADWLGCTDGKWRPVEPGAFPLAHGIAGRVGLLRGYGNAICAPLAAAFVESVIDCQRGL